MTLFVDKSTGLCLHSGSLNQFSVSSGQKVERKTYQEHGAKLRDTKELSS